MKHKPNPHSWDIIPYSNDPRDLSQCKSLYEFEAKLNQSAERVFQAVKPGGILTILIGDKRKNGNYYALMRNLLFNMNIGQLKSLIIKIQHNCKSDRVGYSQNPFLIPIKHEYCLISQKMSPDRS